MAVKRVVDTKFWEDEKVINDYSPEDKYFFLYLLSHWGVMSVDMASAIASDESAEIADAAIDAQPPIYIDDNTDQETGEILPVQDAKGA